MDLPCPKPPDWGVDWRSIEAGLACVERMRACPQDPVLHAEGDVWTHTRLVCEALVGAAAWRALPDPRREALFLAALLHDLGKPDCTRTGSDGRLTSVGHSRRGAVLARRLLWESGTPIDVRERVAALVRFHQRPFWILKQDDPAREVARISFVAGCGDLALLARADAAGRTTNDPARLNDSVALFEEVARENGCLSAPRPFASEHARFLYFRGRWKLPDVAPHEGFRSQVVLLSGLPGAGKDTWLRRHLPGLPVVSLDVLREEMDVEPGDEQGGVVQAAREEARRLLRAGASFVWNATNLSRMIRDRCVALFADYGARVRIVYVESSPEVLRRRNRSRERPVPEQVVERLLDRWEVPDLTEAHQVDWVAGE